MWHIVAKNTFLISFNNLDITYTIIFNMIGK